MYRARLDSNTRDDLFLYNARSKTVDPNAGKWVRVFTQADLTFTAKAGTTVWPAGAKILPVDFSRDGLSEIFSLSPTGTWTVATFSATGVTYTSGSWTPGWQVLRGEFSGDGVPDLLLVKPATGDRPGGDPKRHNLRHRRWHVVKKCHRRCDRPEWRRPDRRPPL